MTDKLLIVHPSKHYDTDGTTRSAICGLMGQYAPEHIFVLYDKTGNFSDYLGCNYVTNSTHSFSGEIDDRTFLSRLMDGCSQVTICGHIGGVCHHASFEDVVKEYRRSDIEQFRVVIPTYAVSSGWLTCSTVRDEIEQKEIRLLPAWFATMHYKLRGYNGISQLSSRELATMDCMHEYVKPCLTGNMTVHVEIDGKVVYTQNGNGKKLALALESGDELRWVLPKT